MSVRESSKRPRAPVVVYDTDEDEAADWFHGPRNAYEDDDYDGMGYGMGMDVVAQWQEEEEERAAEPEVARPGAEPEVAKPGAEPEVAKPGAEPEVARPGAEPEVARPGAEQRIKMFVGGRVTKFKALEARDQSFVELDVLHKLATLRKAVICRPEFGEEGEGGQKHHRAAISFGCSIALQTIRRPRHVVVVCDWTFKANWIRSNIHIQGEGGGVVTHTEFRCGMARKGLFDSKLEHILSTPTELSQTLVIVQGESGDVEQTVAVLGKDFVGLCLVLSSM